MRPFEVTAIPKAANAKTGAAIIKPASAATASTGRGIPAITEELGSGGVLFMT